MWEIWAKELLPKALKTCPKFNNLPNLVTLPVLQLPRCSKCGRVAREKKLHNNKNKTGADAINNFYCSIATLCLNIHYDWMF